MMRLLTTRRSPIGIDLGGRSLRAVQLSGAGEKWRIEAVASVPKTDADAPLSAEDARRLWEVVQRQGFAGARTILGVPAPLLISTIVKLQRPAAAARSGQTIRDEFTKAAALDPTCSEMAYWELPAASRGDNTIDVMAVGCPHSDAGDLLDIAEAAGFDVLALDVECAAIARWSGGLQDRGVMAAVVSVEWQSVDVVVICRETVVYQRSIPEAGLRMLYEELRVRMGLNEEMFGLLFRDAVLQGDGWGFESADAAPSVRSAVTSHFERMSGELKMALSYVAHQYQDETVAGMYVIGDGSVIPGLPDYLSQQLGLQVRSSAPVEFASSAAGPVNGREAAGLEKAIGLAQYFV